MLYNGVIVGRLNTTSTLKGLSIVVTPDGQGGTDIGFAVSSGGGGGTGQTGTDPLVWTGTANGNWSAGVNWHDTVTGKTATLPPGAQTAAQITGPSGVNFQSVSGTGTCASLVLDGNGFFFGSYTAGALSVGQDATQAAAAVSGTLVTNVLTTFTLGSCLIAAGAFLATGSKTVVDVAGTLAVSDGGIGSVLAVSQHAAGQVGALSLGGGSVSVDAVSSLEVGTSGGAATGLLTVDNGASVSGYGTLDLLGSTADNGVVSAAGGTLLVGVVTGTGSLQIATEAALDLTAAASVPIAMTGAGATLILQGAAAVAGGVITGFVPGDSIVTGNTPADSVTYAPGTGGLGTLTLSEAGQIVESLTLAGNYAGEVFSVQPAGAGAVVIVSAASAGGGGGVSGPPAGTVTPDQYVWTGVDGVLWGDAKNWMDTTRSQNPASVAPGQNDLVTIAVPAGAASLVTGPANAAALSLSGNVALAGSYGIGTLSVGSTQQSGVLALGGGASIAAASANVLGGIAGQGGTLAVGGTLSLGQTGLAGLVSATGSSAISADTILMQGIGSQLLTDSTATIEIGGIAQPAPGSVFIDAAGLLIGAGVVNPAGQITDNGVVTASGGTLVLGNVSGSGTLLVGVAATLVLEGSVAAGITADFAAGGTLTLAGSVTGFAGAIADFGPGDQILLPVSGATQAGYAVTGPGLGVLSIYAGNIAIAQLTLLGSQADYVFSVSGSAGGGTILTATPSNTAGEGGTTVGNYPTVSGGFQITPTQLYALAPFAQSYLQSLNNGPPNYNSGDYEFFLAGETTVVGPPFFGTAGLPGLDVEVVGPLSGQAGAGGFGPGDNVALQAGYNALIAEGTEQINLVDPGLGNSLLIGNSNADTLAALGSNDTMVGGVGANTVFWASGGTNVVIQGGGNDSIVTADNSQITTSGGQSVLFLGASTNYVLSDGADKIDCIANGIANDTVAQNAAAGTAGDTVFGPLLGSLAYDGGAAPGTVVGTGGQVVMNGGSGSGNVLWAGDSFAQYNGGSGSAIVVGGSQALIVHGGTAPITVFGGAGPTVIDGTAGNSVFVAGFGPSTISAASGNTVFLMGSAQVSVAGNAGAEVYAGFSDASNIFQANTGSETLWGGAGNDTFFAGSGAGTFVAGGGADIFNFTNGLGGGADVISGFVPGLDTLALHGYGGVIPQLSVVNGSTYFTLSDGTNVEFYNVTNVTGSSFTST